MKNLIIIFFFSFSIVFSKGVYSISGFVHNHNNIKKVYLYYYSYGKYRLFDTSSMTNGKFEFKLTAESPRGIYKISFTPFKSIEEILFNYENIYFQCDLKNLKNSLKFKTSNENQVLRFYKKFTENELHKEKGFLYLMGFYQPEEDFFKQLNDELKRVKLVNQNLIKSLIQDNKHLLVSKYILYDQLPQLQLRGIYSKDKPIVIEHYWDNIDFNDTLLLHLPLFDKKIDNYLILQENDSLDTEEQEKVFIKAIDGLLLRAEVNTTIYKYIAQKLLHDAKQYNLFQLYKHLADLLLTKGLVDEGDKNEIYTQLKKIKKLGIGNKAPDFSITENLKLYDINSKFTLLIFWEADCDICLNKLKEIQKFYNSINDRNTFEIVAINLSSDKYLFKKVILENNYNWINYFDTQGWYSELVNEYGISSTPSMILLDKNKRIIARPVKVSDIRNKIKKD